MKTYLMDEVLDEFIGPIGTSKRDAFEEELRLDLLGTAVREARLQQNLTQQQLAELAGVQKTQIARLESSLANARLGTILKVFKALNAKINFSVELLNQRFQIA